jgi:methyl coenzyme M reductase beta subunit
MNTKNLLAIVLVVGGLLVLAYSGVTFNTPGKPIDFLGVHIETTHSHFIPPVAGAIALAAGIVLLLVKPKQV